MLWAANQTEAVNLNQYAVAKSAQIIYNTATHLLDIINELDTAGQPKHQLHRLIICVENIQIQALKITREAGARI